MGHSDRGSQTNVLNSSVMSLLSLVAVLFWAWERRAQNQIEPLSPHTMANYAPQNYMGLSALTCTSPYTPSPAYNLVTCGTYFAITSTYLFAPFFPFTPFLPTPALPGPSKSSILGLLALLIAVPGLLGGPDDGAKPNPLPSLRLAFTLGGNVADTPPG